MSESVKEKIIQATIELLHGSDGNMAKITSRAISEKAGTSALINYHFGTKKNLVTLCIQRIIAAQIATPQFPEKNYTSARERVTDRAAVVFEFLFANQAVSRISILDDLMEYGKDCNSMKSRTGIMRSMDDIANESDKKVFAFTLVSAMQVAFLSAATFGTSTGFTLDTPQDRRRFISRLVSALYSGFSPESVSCSMHSSSGEVHEQ